MRSDRWLHILQHSLGLDDYGQGNAYRNHFVTGDDCDNHADCMALVEAGLMTCRAGNALTDDMDCFFVTDAGRAYVREHSPPPPKLTRSQRRYREWMESGCDMGFGEWLRGAT